MFQASIIFVADHSGNGFVFRLIFTAMCRTEAPDVAGGAVVGVLSAMVDATPLVPPQTESKIIQLPALRRFVSISPSPECLQFAHPTVLPEPLPLPDAIAAAGAAGSQSAAVNVA